MIKYYENFFHITNPCLTHLGLNDKMVNILDTFKCVFLKENLYFDSNFT